MDHRTKEVTEMFKATGSPMVAPAALSAAALDRHTVTVEPFTGELCELYPAAPSDALLAVVERVADQTRVRFAAAPRWFSSPLNAIAERYADEVGAVYLPPAGAYLVVERALSDRPDTGRELFRGTQRAAQDLVALAVRTSPHRYAAAGGTHRLVVPEVAR